MGRIDHNFVAVVADNSGNGLTLSSQPIYGYIEKIIVNSNAAASTGSFFLVASGGAVSGGTTETVFTKIAYSGTAIASVYPRVTTVDSVNTTLSGTTAGYDKIVSNTPMGIAISGAGSPTTSYFDIIWRTP